MGTKKGGCESGAHLRNRGMEEKACSVSRLFLAALVLGLVLGAERQLNKVAWCGETAEQSLGGHVRYWPQDCGESCFKLFFIYLYFFFLSVSIIHCVGGVKELMRIIKNIHTLFICYF
jgi:hypothetical protein